MPPDSPNPADGTSSPIAAASDAGGTALGPREFRNHTSIMDMAAQVSRIGTWEIDMLEGRPKWSDITREIHEVPLDFKPDLQTAIEFYKEGEHRDRIATVVERAMATGQGWDLELLLVTAKGREIWVRAIGRGELTDGQVARVYGTFQDIDRQVRARHELERVTSLLATAKERLELATRASRIGIWDWNMVDDVLTWDDQMFVLYGTDRESFTGSYQDWHAPLHPDDVERTEADVADALAGTRDFHTEFRVRHADGTVRHLRALAKVVRGEDGQPLRMIGTNWDITDAVLQREELRDFARRADAANRAKSQFLATMSHEIRTPMNGVIGFCQLLLASELNEEQRDFVESIRVSGETLVTIIDDLLDISKIEAGKMQLEIEPVELRRIVIETSSLWFEEANRKRLSLTIDDQTDPDTRVHADATRTRQVLINLVGNAIKFTPDGSVHLRIQARPTTGVVRIEVEDTGIGIAMDKRAGLFETFTQGDSSTTRRFGGTGLGLAISKHLVELMGGAIGFESQEGVGSTFWFTLPLADR